MDVRDLGMPAEFLADLGQHALLVVDPGAGDGLFWQVVGNVAVDQVLDGRRCPAFSLVTGGIDPAIYGLA